MPALCCACCGVAWRPAASCLGVVCVGVIASRLYASPIACAAAAVQEGVASPRLPDKVLAEEARRRHVWPATGQGVSTTIIGVVRWHTRQVHMQNTVVMANPMTTSDDGGGATGSFDKELGGATATKNSKSGKASHQGGTLVRALEDKLKVVKELRKFVDLNVFGSTADADEAAFVLNEDLKHRWGGLLHPDTTVSSCYDFGQMALIIYLLFTLPYNLAFNIKPAGIWFAFELIVDLALVFDIFLSMFRFYHHPRSNELVTDKRIIRHRYMRSWFIVDVTAVIPFDYLIVLVYLWTDTDSTSVR